ncbi:hypothetical protein RD110_15520 [Rhodoferax koreense]|uniref:Peptidase C51 domain-containing protein n=1 Tax=Rhodoferax koreensis TaxID=1842727 RepID=A0A1P8JXK8_9BURK|nr:hypothetical protein [Rhodoferax koreense]APW38431.1 hypothetical protein RD110_15520 [Rhodoferax koreense]
MRTIKALLATALLCAMCCVWLAAGRWRQWRGLPVKDNCFTWAVRNSSYDAGDGLMLHKSSSGWFPHVSVVRGARSKSRTRIAIEEFIPRHRVPQQRPPTTFDGQVRRTVLIRESESLDVEF